MTRLFGDDTLIDHVDDLRRIEGIRRGGGNEAAGYFQVQLLLFFQRDQTQSLAGKRCIVTDDKERSLHDLPNVKIQHFRKACAVGGDSFSGTQLDGLTVRQNKPEGPFQAKPFAEGVMVAGGGGMKFADASGACDRDGDPSGSDCRAALAFRYLKKNRAIDKIHLPRALVETEDRIRAEAGHS